MKSFTTAILFAMAGSAAAKKVQVAVTGYYNGIDTIGGSGSTAHFQGVQVNCVGGDKKMLCEDKSGDGITCKGDKEVFLGCNGLPIWYKSTLNCGKEKIEKCHARSTEGFGNTIKDDDLHGGYSNIGIGSSEVSQCVSIVEFDVDDSAAPVC